MTEIVRKEKYISLLDKCIFFFLALFVITLTNSIFLNQIGYFGALILVLVRAAQLKNNPFRKNGLEIILILFIVSEIISTIVSYNQTQSIEYALKRFLLLPTLYLIPSAISNVKILKRLTYIFLGAAFLTTFIYNIAAIIYYLNESYSIQGKGPSIFQYVMTAGGLTSFTTLMFLSFAMNSKDRMLLRMFYIFSFFSGSFALIASYSRGAWVGTIAGVAVILILKRQWLLIILGISAVSFFIFSSSSFSRLVLLELNSGNPKVVASIDTKGKAVDVLMDSSFVVLADYNGGINIYHDKQLIENIETPAPVTLVYKWNEYYLAKLVDNRFLLYQKSDEGKLEIANRFISPGFIQAISLFKNFLYIADKDSGITVYENRESDINRVRFPKLDNFRSIDIDSNYLTAWDKKFKKIYLFSLNIQMPAVLVDSLNIDYDEIRICLFNDHLIFTHDEQLDIYSIENRNFSFHKSISDIGRVNKIETSGSSVFLLNFSNELLELKRTNDFNIINKYKLKFDPSSFYVKENQLATSNFKVNRFLSIIDKNHNTNIERLHQWKTAIEIWKDHKIFGVGDIGVEHIYAKYKPKYLRENFGHLHSNYFHALVILGLFGFLVIMVLFVKIIIIELKIFKNAKPNSMESSFAIGSLAIFVSFLVSGLTEWNFGDHEIITMIWFTFSLNYAFFYFRNNEFKQTTNHN